MAIDTLTFINGIFSLVYVIINTIVGLKIAHTYFKIKKTVFLYMGFAWVGMGAPWWPSSVSFLFAVFTGSGISLEAYLLIFLPFSPLSMVLFAMALCELKYPRKKKIVLIIFVIVGIIIEVYLFYFIFTDPSVIGSVYGIVDVQYRGIIIYWLIFDFIVIIIIGLLIAHDSLVSDNPEVKKNGKFILVAFIFWAVGAIADAIAPLSLIFVTLPIRIILISSAFMFYRGYAPPDVVKRFISKIIGKLLRIFLKHKENIT